jgi:hypothetical protein
MPIMLSIVEVCIACLCASTPFFWPIFREGLDKIFVMYEFNVSSESRYHDDHVELAPTTSWEAGTKAPGGKEDIRSLESISGDLEPSKTSNQLHYRNDYIQNQVDPFGEEFQTESTVKVGHQTSKKKGGGVQLDSTV